MKLTPDQEWPRCDHLIEKYADEMHFSLLASHVGNWWMQIDRKNELVVYL